MKTLKLIFIIKSVKISLNFLNLKLLEKINNKFCECKDVEKYTSGLHGPFVDVSKSKQLLHIDVNSS